MKRLSTKIMTIAACAAMMLTAAPFANVNTVQAAVKSQGTVNLATTTKKLTIPKGTSTVIKNNTLTMVKGRRYAVKFKINGKAYNLATLPTTVGKAKVNTTAIASIKNNLLTANKAGTTTFRIVKGTKNLVSLKVKVIDTAAHKHSWKNITKATCAAKGKKLCKTCGATGTTAMSKTHSFKVTKKATCERKGVETCTTCGLQNTLPKTAHNYKTETWTGVEGRGKPYYVTTWYCNGCNVDMTNWSLEKEQAHQSDIDGMEAGTANWDCFGAGTHGAGGEERYHKYVMIDLKETYCETCGTAKDKIKKELYEVYYDEWRNVVRKSDNKIIEESVYYKNYKPYLDAAKKAAARRPAVAAPQDTLTAPGNGESFEETDVIVSDNAAVSENEVISDNSISDNEIIINGEVVIDNNELNTEITDLETGGDSVLENQDDEGIIIEEVDETDTEDDGTDDYDESEGIVIEDE